MRVESWVKASLLGLLVFGPLLSLSLARGAEWRRPVEAGNTGWVGGLDYVVDARLMVAWWARIETVRVDWDHGVDTWELQISDYGWTYETIATGSATYPSSVIPVGRRARYVRLIGRSKTDRWLRIRDLTAYARR